MPHLLVVLRAPPERWFARDADALLGVFGVRVLAPGVYLVPDSRAAVAAARALTGRIRREGGRALLARASIVGAGDPVVARGRPSRGVERP